MIYKSRYLLWQKGAIEKHLELENKSSAEHVRFAKQLKDGGYEGLADLQTLKLFVIG